MNNTSALKDINKSLVKIKSILEFQRILKSTHHKFLTRDAIKILMVLKYDDYGYTLQYPKHSPIYMYMPIPLRILYRLHLVYVGSKRIDMPNWPLFIKADIRLTASGRRYTNKVLPESAPDIRKQELEIDMRQDDISQIQTERDFADANRGNPIIPKLISGSGVLLGSLIAICMQGVGILSGLLLICSIVFYIWTLVIGYGHENDAIDQKSNQRIPELQQQIKDLRQDIDEAYQYIYTNYKCSLLDFELINVDKLMNTYYPYEQTYNWLTQVMFKNK